MNRLCSLLRLRMTFLIPHSLTLFQVKCIVFISTYSLYLQFREGDLDLHISNTRATIIYFTHFHVQINFSNRTERWGPFEVKISLIHWIICETHNQLKLQSQFHANRDFRFLHSCVKQNFFRADFQIGFWIQ